MLPEIAGGLIGGVGSIANSIISYLGASSVNETNKQIAEMNNRTMIQAMREQTKSEQDYNSASAQMKRAMIAGLNPQTLAGQTPATASSSGVPSLDSPVLQNPFTGFRSGLNDLGSAMIQGRQFDLQDRNLDLQDLSAKIDMLKVAGDLLKDTNVTSEDVNNIVKSIFGDSEDTISFENMFKDDFIRRRLRNEIEISDVDKDSKKYLYTWLDEMTNAQYVEILSRTENYQTGSKKMRSEISLNSIIGKLKESERKHVEQAISNMKEQWKSLNFQGELDVKKLERVAEISDSIVRDLVAKANISEDEAKYFIWRELNGTNPLFRDPLHDDDGYYPIRPL